MTHRWFTSALVGKWCLGPDEALYDALRAGQAVRNSGQNDEIVLRTFTGIEVREPKFGGGSAKQEARTISLTRWRRPFSGEEAAHSPPATSPSAAASASS